MQNAQCLGLKGVSSASCTSKISLLSIFNQKWVACVSVRMTKAREGEVIIWERKESHVKRIYRGGKSKFGCYWLP